MKTEFHFFSRRFRKSLFRSFVAVALQLASPTVGSAAAPARAPNDPFAVFTPTTAPLEALLVPMGGPGSSYRLTPAMRNYLEQVLTLTERYGLSLAPLRRALLGERAEYRTVGDGSLPCRDDPMPITTSGAHQANYGCTDGAGVTYLSPARLRELVRDNPGQTFKLIALSAFVHEKLHTLILSSGDAAADHVRIARFITALYRLISIRELQNAGSREPLIGADLRILNGLRAAAADVGATDTDVDPVRGNLHVDIHAVGGGAVVSKANVPLGQSFSLAHDAFMGVGSRVDVSECALVDGFVQPNTQIEEAVTLIDSVVSCGIRMRKVTAVRSNFRASGKTWDSNAPFPFVVGGLDVYDSRVTDSQIVETRVFTSALTGVVGQNAYVEGSVLVNVPLDEQRVAYSEIEVSPGQSIDWKANTVKGCKYPDFGGRYFNDVPVSFPCRPKFPAVNRAGDRTPVHESGLGGADDVIRDGSSKSANFSSIF